MEMINSNTTRYAIDMQKVMKWVSYSPSNEKNINTIITQVYGSENNHNDDEIITKEITENKSTINENLSNVRYDILRLLINTLFADDARATPTYCVGEMTFSQRMAFETLLQEGFINEIND